MVSLLSIISVDSQEYMDIPSRYLPETLKHTICNCDNKGIIRKLTEIKIRLD